MNFHIVHRKLFLASVIVALILGYAYDGFISSVCCGAIVALIFSLVKVLKEKD